MSWLKIIESEFSISLKFSVLTCFSFYKFTYTMTFQFLYSKRLKSI